MATQELETDEYDVIVLGTGLAESIAAAALAKAGKTVLHLDQNEYYGSSQASLTLDELLKYQSAGPSSSLSSSSSGSTVPTQLSDELERDKRRYALSLFPAVVPSRGALIDTLIASDVSKYVSFRMLDSVSIWSPAVERSSTDTVVIGDASQSGEEGGPAASSETVGTSSGGSKGGLRRVPGSKEQVFKDQSVSLINKRKLMRFLMLAAGEFESSDLVQGKEALPLVDFLRQTMSLPLDLSESIAYAIAHCSSPRDPTLPALQRTRRYAQSVGRYGSGAFLVGQYGGAGEVAQGFCRACAVYGGTYILGESARPSDIALDADTGRVKLKISCHPRPVSASHFIASSSHIPQDLMAESSKRTIHRAQGIAILASLPPAFSSSHRAVVNSGESEEQAEEDDTAVVIFPPEQEGQVVRALLMGEGTGSCPAGQFLLYLDTTVPSESTDPFTTLQPYLRRLAPEALFESYRLTSIPSYDQPSDELPRAISDRVILLNPYAGDQSLTEGLDWEAERGKAAYEAVMGTGADVRGFFEKLEGEVNEDEEM